MGLDILIRTDIDDVIFTNEYHDPKFDYFNKHSLSRTFCNFMCKQNVINGIPELDQIGKITSTNIKPLYEMENYISDDSEELEFQLNLAESEEEKQDILNDAKEKRNNLKGNIDKVLFTIQALINKLSVIESLPELLNNYGHDTLDYEKYFTDFNIDKGQGYSDNNFGQDLRNFRRFLEFAKTKGATSVYFLYG
jgi:hypothetical protein